MARGDVTSPLCLEALKILARTTTEMLQGAMNNKTEWPTVWIADIHDAHRAILADPRSQDRDVLTAVHWLRVMQAHGLEPDVLRQGFARFPVSGGLHEYMRYQVLRDRGAEALQRAYARMQPAAEHAPSISWYAGLASLQAAERDVQCRKSKAALASYQRSVRGFRESFQANPAFEDSATKYICLALSGRSRVLADQQQWSEAVDAIQKGIGARAASAATKDGLGNTPAANASRLHWSLIDAGKEAEAKSLKKTLGGLGVQISDRPPRGRRGGRRGR